MPTVADEPDAHVGPSPSRQARVLSIMPGHRYRVQAQPGECARPNEPAGEAVQDGWGGGGGTIFCSLRLSGHG